MHVDDLFAPEVLRAITKLNGAPPPGGSDLAARVRLQRRVARVLSELGVRPGMRVLELGTGTGWSACLLAQLVGPGGSVISVDPDRLVTEQARTVRSGPGRERLLFHTWALRAGWAPGAPYDLVLSWRCVPRLPHAWLHQCRPPTATLLTPVTVTATPGLLGLLRLGIDEERQPIRAHLLPDAHATGTGYGTAMAVRLHGDPDGYTVHLPQDGIARTAAPDTSGVQRSPSWLRRASGR